MVGIFLRKIERGNACGRKGSIRDLQPGRQLHCRGADRIHRDRDKLRHVGSAPRHSSNQQELLLPEAPDCAADHKAEVGADRGRAERAVEDGVVEKRGFILSFFMPLNWYKFSKTLLYNYGMRLEIYHLAERK